jgi:hypothetical protein
MQTAIDVELVTRDGCHLCDIAAALLRSAARELPLRVITRDVDADPELLRLYDLRVPVVIAGGREICEGVFTPGDLRRGLLGAAA